MQVAIAAMLSSAWPKPAPSSVSPSGTTSPTGSKSPITRPYPASPPSSNTVVRRPDRPHFCPSYIGGNQQAVGVGITLATHELPPAPDGIDGEGRGVAVDAQAHPSGVASDVVDAIGHRPPELGNNEVVDATFFGCALWPPFATAILEVADEFLLLRVDRDRRFTGCKRFLHSIVDVVELRVAIRMVRSFARLAIGLQAVIELVQ